MATRRPATCAVSDRQHRLHRRVRRVRLIRRIVPKARPEPVRDRVDPQILEQLRVRVLAQRPPQTHAREYECGPVAQLRHVREVSPADAYIPE